MTGVKKRRNSRSRQTKAQLIEELEGLESELAETRLAKGARNDAVAGTAWESEALVQAVFENSPAAILLKDPDGIYLKANRTWYEWFNPDGEDILGKTVYDFYDKDHADEVTALDREVVKTGEGVSNELKIPLTDGRVLDGTLHKFPIHGADGKVIAVGGIHFDVSEVKQAEEALKQSQNRLNEALQSLQQGFALYDADDRLIAFNDEYEHLRPGAKEIMEKGGTFEDVIRKNIEYEIIPEAYGREEEFIKERIKEHQNPEGTIIRRFRDGSWSQIEEVRTPSGGIAILFTDITDLKRAEEALVKSEALFRAVVNHTPAKIHIKDVEGRYTLINKEAASLFGITDEEGRGKTSFDLFPKEVAEAFTAHDKGVIESGQALEEEEEFTKEDGIHTYLTVKFPIYDLDGVSGVGAVGTDITERKKAEKSNARLNTAISALSEGISLYDADNRLVFFNEQSRKFNERIIDILAPGLHHEDLLRAHIKKGSLPEAIGREEEWIKERLERRRNPRAPFEMQIHDGIWLRVREQRLPDGGTLTMTSDITERVKGEAALREAMEMADYANRAKTEFLANMSHELRTPLNSILGFSEVMMMGDLGNHGDSKYREYAKDIHYSGSHLLSLINEVLDLSKLEVGEVAIDEDDIDVTEVIKTCIKMVKMRSSEKETSISTNLNAGLPHLRVDELRFKQILINLLGNAIKFTPPDGDVSVSARVNGIGEYIIEVEDTGVGIAAVDIPKVLEPFGQVHDILTRHHEGSGLGLHLAKSFTELHGGTLNIESTPGEGTTVILMFPKERTVQAVIKTA